MKLKLGLIGLVCATTLFSCGKKEVNFETFIKNHKDKAAEKYGAYKKVSVTGHLKVIRSDKSVESDTTITASAELNAENPWTTMPGSDIKYVANYETKQSSGDKFIDELIDEYLAMCHLHFLFVGGGPVLNTYSEDPQPEPATDFKFYENPVTIEMMDVNTSIGYLEYDSNYFAHKLVINIVDRQSELNYELLATGTDYILVPKD